MSCDAERVTGYVDGALPPEERAALEAHMAECPRCREQVSAERALRDGLRGLPAPEPRPGFEEEVRRRLARMPSRARWLLPLAAGLVLALLWGRGSASFVAWELARDHAHCFGLDRLPAAILSADPEEVTAFFEANGTRLPLVPSSAGGLGLLGARYCRLLDRVAAHLYYGGDGKRLSLFVFAGPARFPATGDLSAGGRSVRLLHVEGTTVGIVSEGREETRAFERALTTAVATLTPGPRS